MQTHGYKNGIVKRHQIWLFYMEKLRIAISMWKHSKLEFYFGTSAYFLLLREQEVYMSSECDEYAYVQHRMYGVSSV